MAMPDRRPRFGDAAANHHAIRDRQRFARQMPRGPRGLMLRRWTFPPWTRQIAPSKVFMAIAWIGMNPAPHARQERLASSVSQLWRLADTKKPGPSLL